MRKSAIIVVMVLLTIGMITVCGCSGGGEEADVKTDVDTYIYTGTYVNESNNSEYIEIKSNNTFTMMKEGEAVSGSYDIEEGTLRMSAGSFDETMKISAGVITSDDGKKFVLAEEVKGDGSPEDSASLKEAIEKYCQENGIDIASLTVSAEKEVSEEDQDWEIDYAFPAEAEGEGQFFLLHRVGGDWVVVAHTEKDQTGWTAAELEALGAPVDLTTQ